MRGSMLETVLRLLRPTPDGEGAVTDAQLLHRYSHTRDELAFTELVRRHGPMVLGVCRRLLRDRHAAEDAFQATFLVLVRRARTVRWHDSITSWLYEVACRTARKARSRPALVPVAVEDTSMLTTLAEHDLELGEVLDDVLASLPPHYRTALLLCCEAGKTEEKAACELGCALGTVKSRLARARALLRKRLDRRGVIVPAGVAVWLSGTRSAEAVPVALLQSVVSQATAFAGGPALRTSAALLAQAVLRGSRLARIKACFYLIACAALAIIVGTYALGGFGSPSPADPPPDPVGPVQPAPERPVAVAPDGKLAATADDDGNSVRFWDLATGKQVGQFAGTPGLVEGMQFSPDGALLAVSATDTTVVIVDVRDVVAGQGSGKRKDLEGRKEGRALAPRVDQALAERVPYPRSASGPGTRGASALHSFFSSLEGGERPVPARGRRPAQRHAAVGPGTQQVLPLRQARREVQRPGGLAVIPCVFFARPASVWSERLAVSRSATERRRTEP